MHMSLKSQHPTFLSVVSFFVLNLTFISQTHAVDDGSQMNEKFRINYAGYLPQASKTALYLRSNTGAINWSLSGSSCSGSEDTYVSNDVSSGDSFYVIDFSECTDVANNVRLVVGGDQSLPFDISNDPYGNIKYEFFDYFKDHEGSATFQNAKNNWETGLNISFSYVKDAGDNGAYPTNTAEASWALINMLETYPAINTYYSNNFSGAKTVYDQLLVLTEQFNHVFSHSGNLAIPKFHTNVNSSWAACSPHTSGTCIAEPETKATFATARTLAAMARLHDTYATASLADSAYAAAKNALNSAQQEPLTCRQANSFGGEGGMYPDNDNYSLYRNPKTDRDNCVPDPNNTEDDEYTALVEIYIAAEKLGKSVDAASYKTQVMSHPRFDEASSFWWGAVAMEGGLSLLSNENIHSIDLTNLKNNIIIKADEIMANQALGYPGVTWDPTSDQWDSGDQDNVDNNVRWGSHRMALNDARILMAASEIKSGESQTADAALYARSAIKVLDHISGINAVNLTMYTTQGYPQFENSVTRTHDGANSSDSWAGKMVLGPNNWTNADDGAMPAFGSQPGLKMFALTGTGWSSREISIDANASLVPVAYFTTEVAPAILALDPIGGPVVPPANIPAVPSGLSANATAGAIDLSWTDNAGNNDDAENGYRIYQSTSNSKPASATHTTAANVTNWSATSLQADTTYYFWVEAFNDNGTSASISASATTPSAPVATNILTNGDFENGVVGWACTTPGGSATCSVVNGEYYVSISNGGSTAWHIQPKQGSFSLVSGTTYTFAFDARSTGNRNTEIKVERDGSPWEDFSQTGSGQSLTTTMQRFVYTFNMSTSLNNARVVLNIGNNNNDVIVDNMWLVEGNADPCAGVVGCGSSEPVETHDITVSAGANGSISPGSLTVNDGDDQTFSISADAGYHILDVLKNGVSLGPVTSVTFNNVTSDQTLSATFEQDTVPTHTISVSAGANGSISPGSMIIDEGSNQTFTISANAGYHILNVVKNGVSLGAVTSVTFNNVTSDQTLSATFEQDAVVTHDIAVSAGANGSISPGTTTVNDGANQTFTITADSGYVIDDVLVNGSSVGAVDTYTFTNVTSDRSISATFKVENTGGGFACNASNSTTVTAGGGNNAAQGSCFEYYHNSGSIRLGTWSGSGTITYDILNCNGEVIEDVSQVLYGFSVVPTGTNYCTHYIHVKSAPSSYSLQFGSW